MQCKVLILDEPTSSLTDKEIARLFALIKKLKSQGIAVIYISHKLEEVLMICDRVTALKDGEMSGTKLIAEVSKDDMVSMMIGRALNHYYPEKEMTVQPEILFEGKNLCAGNLVQNVSFQVHKGEILGMAGLVGAGRSETVRAIFGADKLESGGLYLNGKRIANRTPAAAIQNKIAFVTEDRRNEGLVMTLSVRENTTLASFQTFTNRLGIINAKKEQSIAQSYIDRMKTRTSGLEQKVVHLSGGNQQKVVISKWLIPEQISTFLMNVNLAREGKGIIVISSELPEVMGISDRIIVMHEGRLSGEVQREAFSEKAIMTLAVGGE